ncbi:hypothetical protein [Streptomyces sp. NPDC048269]|uniref:hypothetical protein n=1 Tax=Streptomyces sp. NPDC048269 TaxID=3155753 RepID=UPI00343AFA30
MDPVGRSLPDIGKLTLSSLAFDSSGTAAEFRSLIFSPDVPERMAAFNSEIGGDSLPFHPDVPERMAAFSSEIGGDSPIVNPEPSERMAAFQSEIGGDQCLVPSTNSS